MPRKRVDANTLRFLYGKSGNKCAFPDCCEPIFEDDGTLTGECCHIEAFSHGGARYNSDTTIEEKNAENNLILLCARHHKIIDTHPHEFTAEYLREMKQAHEQQYSRVTRELNNHMLFALQRSMVEYWNKLQLIDAQDSTDLKIKINPTLSIVGLFRETENAFDNIVSNIDFLGQSDRDTEIELKKLCEQAGVDFSMFENIPYYKNPFCNRNWETHNLALPNWIKHTKLFYFELCVKVLEKLAMQDSTYGEQLEQYKQKLREFHEHNYYND